MASLLRRNTLTVAKRLTRVAGNGGILTGQASNVAAASIRDIFGFPVRTAAGSTLSLLPTSVFPPVNNHSRHRDLGNHPSPLAHPRSSEPRGLKPLTPAIVAPLGVRAYSNKSVSKWKAAGAAAVGVAILGLSVPFFAGLLLASVAVAAATAATLAAIRVARAFFPPTARPPMASSRTSSPPWPWARERDADVSKGPAPGWLGDGATAQLYDAARSAVLNSPLAAQVLGGQIDTSPPFASSASYSFFGCGAIFFPFGGGRGAAKEIVSIEFMVSGASGSAVVAAEGEAAGDELRITQLMLAPRGGNSLPIDLLQEEPGLTGRRHVAAPGASMEDDGGFRSQDAAAPSSSSSSSSSPPPPPPPPPPRPGVRRATPKSRLQRVLPRVVAEYREVN